MKHPNLIENIGGMVALVILGCFGLIAVIGWGLAQCVGAMMASIHDADSPPREITQETKQ